MFDVWRNPENNSENVENTWKNFVCRFDVLKKLKISENQEQLFKQTLQKYVELLWFFE